MSLMVDKVPTMQVPHNPADSDWHIVGQTLDTATEEWVISWAAKAGCQGHGCGCEPLREVRCRNEPSLVVERDGEAKAYINLPARMTARLTLSEGYRYKDDPAKGMVYRTKELDLVIDRDDAGSEPRVIVDSVTIRRFDASQVTTASLRAPLGDLVEWMLTREPVTQLRHGESPGGKLSKDLAREALKVAGRKSGKRGDRVLPVEEVVEVCSGVDPEHAASVARQALPNHAYRTILRALGEARAAGLLPHSRRSARAAHGAFMARGTGEQG